jgi:hypothetical protein
MLSSGGVTKDWWLEKESTSTCNHLLPSCLSVHFKHKSFSPMQLQQIALQFAAELNEMKHGSVSHILRVGYRGRGLKFAATALSARQRSARQARMLLKQVERAKVANLGVKALGGLEGCQINYEVPERS